MRHPFVRSVVIATALGAVTALVVAFGLEWRATTSSPAKSHASGDEAGARKSQAPDAQDPAGAGGALAAGDAGDARDRLGAGAGPARLAGALLSAHVRSFFEAPRLTPSGEFVREPQPVRWEGACGEGPSTGRFADLGDFARGLGASAARYPQDVPFSNLNEFFKKPDGSAFVQLSVLPAQGVGTPEAGPDALADGGFRVDMFVAKDAALTQEEARGRLAPAPGQPALTRAAALAVLAKAAEGLVKDGYLRGSRGYVSAPASASARGNDGVLEVSGGRVSRLDVAEVRCSGIGETVCACEGALPKVE